MKLVPALLLPALFALLAACGSDEPCHNDDCAPCHDVECGNSPDTPTVPDAPETPVAEVAEVACGASIALTFATDDGAYNPQSGSIASGAIVKFQMAGGLEVQSGTPASPTETFAVVPDATGCFQFNQAGVYSFFSSTHALTLRHDITGSITVQ